MLKIEPPVGWSFGEKVKIISYVFYSQLDSLNKCLNG